MRLWINGLLAGGNSAPAEATPSRPLAGDGPLVLWASQTGNAEDFATRLAERIGGSQLVNMDDVVLSDLVARDVLVITSTFGDGGPPDNGADFWGRLDSPEAPALTGIRYAVLGIGDRSYDNFCGHAKSIDSRFAALARRGCLNAPSARPTTTNRCTGGPTGSPR